MITTFERQNDILRLISNLDITPTMYENAVEKYKAIASFLSDCGIDADIYPQGSFAFGTVVRPNVKDPDASYDLDFICQLHMTKEETSPSDIRRKIEHALTSSNRYGGKLAVWEECFTIQYADINGVSFTIDIVPAADESGEKKQALMLKSKRPDLLGTAIAIPRHNGNRNYSWLTNNPRGFKQWFDEINKPFLDNRKLEIRKAIFESNQHVYASIEEIPSEMERSSMQRVIQILKFHRDTYYANRRDGDTLKPISAIINTLVAEISKEADPNWDVFSLLTFVLKELEVYAQHLRLHPEMFRQMYGTRATVSKKDGKWVIQNPANPEDNLANKWNENADIPRVFFAWISICRQDLLESMKLSDDKFRSCMENAFGPEIIKKSWGEKYCVCRPKPIDSVTAPKPYRSN